MCCLCFEKVPTAEAYTDAKGQRWDVCKTCGETDAASTSVRGAQ